MAPPNPSSGQGPRLSSSSSAVSSSPQTLVFGGRPSFSSMRDNSDLPSPLLRRSPSPPDSAVISVVSLVTADAAWDSSAPNTPVPRRSQPPPPSPSRSPRRLPNSSQSQSSFSAISSWLSRRLRPSAALRALRAFTGLQPRRPGRSTSRAHHSRRTRKFSAPPDGPFSMTGSATTATAGVGSARSSFSASTSPVATTRRSRSFDDPDDPGATSDYGYTSSSSSSAAWASSSPSRLRPRPRSPPPRYLACAYIAATFLPCLPFVYPASRPAATWARILQTLPAIVVLYALLTINWPDLSYDTGGLSLVDGRPGALPGLRARPGPEYPPKPGPDSPGIAKYPTLALPFSCDRERFEFQRSVVGTVGGVVPGLPNVVAVVGPGSTSGSTAQPANTRGLVLTAHADNGGNATYTLAVAPSEAGVGAGGGVARAGASAAELREAYPRSPGKVDVIFVSEKNEDARFVNWFHGSLRDAGWKGKVVIFSDDPTRPGLLSVVNHYRSLGADIAIEQFSDPDGYGLVYARFFMYKRHMDLHWRKYRRVILSDYDVVWQRDPASEAGVALGADDGQGLALFAEWANFTIGECEHHKRWMKCGENSGVWSEGTFERMMPYARICAGVVVGHSFPVYVLLGHWTAQLLATNLCNDQGILNYLYYTCRLSRDVPRITVYRNEDGPGASMGTNPHFWYNRFGELLNANNQPYTFVHQYPYFPSVLSLFMGRWPLLNTNPSPAYISTCRVRVLWHCWDTSDVSAWEFGETPGARNGYMILLRFENWLVRTFAWWKAVGEGKVAMKAEPVGELAGETDDGLEVVERRT